MSTTQELIDGLRAADGRLPALGRLHAYPDAPSVRDLVLLSADRLASLSAELEALKAKLAGVDERALEVAARILAGAATPTEMEDSGFNAYHRIEYVEVCWRDHADRARAAITAYLAEVRDRE